MAEAAGVYYAVETFVEGAVAAAKGIYDPTLPLRVNLVPADAALPRYAHSVSLVKGRAYIFGGVTSNGDGKEQVADNDIHVLILPQSGMEKTDYKRISATADSPPARYGHSAAVLDDQIYIYGGSDTLDGPGISDEGTVWTFNTTTSKWAKMQSSNAAQSPLGRLYHASAISEHPRKPKKRTDADQAPQLDIDPAKILPEPEAAGSYGTLIIHGGVPSVKEIDAFSDVWSFDIASKTWAQLPSPSSPTHPSTAPSLALTGSRLYTFTAGQVQYMDLATQSFSDKGGQGELGISALGPWTPVERSSSDAGPGERSGAGLEVVTTGQGRYYLILVGGEQPSSLGGGEAKGDIWTLQLRPEGMTAASFKDAARMAIKKDTGEKEWAEVRYFDAEGVMVQEGQTGRGIGPRTGFACGKDWDEDGGTVFVHGGKADGKVLGDGMLVTVDI